MSACAEATGPEVAQCWSVCYVGDAQEASVHSEKPVYSVRPHAQEASVPPEAITSGRPQCVPAGAQLTRGIEKTAAALVEELKALSVAVRDEDLANVATVSAGGNEVVRARCWPPGPSAACRPCNENGQ